MRCEMKLSRANSKRCPALNPNGIPPQSPRLRGTSYLGKPRDEHDNPNGVVAMSPVTFPRHPCRNPVGVDGSSPTFTQGSSFLATLGFKPQSLWDCPDAKPGRYIIALKVIDIFGNDARTLMPVTVG